jgi:glyoxylase-like metal-dependent hydrolase (beta-lactamase superfamily II)
MATDTRLYLFTSGSTRTEMQFLTLNQGHGEPVSPPLPFYVVTHPEGNVLIDGGNPLAVAEDKRAYWGEIVDLFDPVMSPEDHVVAQLEATGIDPESIRYVVQTHLHIDHTGAIGHFPNAKFIIQRRELDYARSPLYIDAGVYLPADIAKTGEVDWLFLDGYDDDGYDVHGDGVIRLLFTPGHAPGHTSVLVSLPETGEVLLAIDAAYTMAHFEQMALPGVVNSGVDLARSVARLRRVADRGGALVVPGHDPTTRETLKHAPEYYG